MEILPKLNFSKNQVKTKWHLLDSRISYLPAFSAGSSSCPIFFAGPVKTLILFYKSPRNKQEK